MRAIGLCTGRCGAILERGLDILIFIPCQILASNSLTEPEIVISGDTPLPR